jgi:hypothetical protein
MPSDVIKYWLAVAAIMLAMFGYSGRISSVLIFGAAAAGAFVYWRVATARRNRVAARVRKDAAQDVRRRDP